MLNFAEAQRLGIASQRPAADTAHRGPATGLPCCGPEGPCPLFSFSPPRQTPVKNPGHTCPHLERLPCAINGQNQSSPGVLSAVVYAWSGLLSLSGYRSRSKPLPTMGFWKRASKPTELRPITSLRWAAVKYHPWHGSVISLRGSLGASRRGRWAGNATSLRRSSPHLFSHRERMGTANCRSPNPTLTSPS